MKRTVLFFMLTLSVVSLMSAQGRDRRGQGQGHNSRRNEQFNNNRRQRHFRQDFQQPRHYPAPGFNREKPRNFSRAQTESANVSGNLTITRGMIAVEKDGITYLTFGLHRFVGFIDGLKEGAQVTLDGMAATNPRNDKVKILHVHKMTLNGKEYDLANFSGNPAPRTRERQPGR